tara:strand:- start:1112 stop:1474 length:363 start_codon:yes stop_codon:yes gene_type:complete
MNEWDWVPMESTHDCTKEYIVINIPSEDVNTVLYDKFCELYGKDYVDRLNREFTLNIFTNSQMGEHNVDVYIKPDRSGLIDCSGWDWTVNNYFPGLDYYSRFVFYDYHEFLLISLTNKPG